MTIDLTIHILHLTLYFIFNFEFNSCYSEYCVTLVKVPKKADILGN